MKDLVDRVVGADDADVLDNAGGEVEVLPRPAVVLGVVDHTEPVVLVHRQVHHVRVGTPVRAQNKNNSYKIELQGTQLLRCMRILLTTIHQPNSASTVVCLMLQT